MKIKTLTLLFCVVFLVSGCAGEASWDNKPETEKFNILVPKSNTILAIYDGSEKTSRKDNAIKNFVEEDITSLGFKVVYHDINKGLPSTRATKNIRGIITWFTDSKMKNARSYCEWLSEELEEGKKVIMFGNFGAYQDTKTEAWTKTGDLNQVFNRLGVEYKGNWTEDDKVLAVVYKDPKIVEKVIPFNLNRIRHYYHFSKLDDDVKPFLVVRRKDISLSDSQIIFSHSSGGMALSRYLIVFDKKKGYDAVNVDVKEFVNECFLETEGRKEQKVLIIWDKEGDKNNRYIKNLTKTLEYAKIKFDTIEFKDLKSLLIYDIKKYSSIVLITEFLWTVTDENLAEVFREYVNDGGGIFVFLYCDNPMFNELFGIVDNRDFYGKTLRGLKTSKIFFPGSEDVLYVQEDLAHYPINFVLKDDVEILARTKDTTNDHPEGIPIAWLNRVGKGRVIFWNSECMGNKGLRGFVLQSLMLSQGMGGYSIANIENVHMDDCPEPMYNVLKEPIKTDYDMTDTRFYMDVWWKDILSLSKKYGIRFTFYAIFNYGGNIKPPFKNSEFRYGENNAFEELVKRIYANNFELGLHGYNHQSLIKKTKDVPGWTTSEYMKEAIAKGKEFWRQTMPSTEMPFSYVAPMNVIGPMGKKALHEILPTIKVISQHYSDAVDLRTQEFGPDPDVKEFFGIPRVTAGYVFSQDTKNNMLNLLNTFGVWTHFLHPDDVFGIYSVGKDYGVGEGEGAKKWEDMLSSTHQMFDYARKKYPWLRNMSTKDAYYEFVRYFDRETKLMISEDNITLDFTSGESFDKYFVLRLKDNQKIAGLKNCELVHSYDDIKMYVFKTNTNNARINVSNR